MKLSKRIIGFLSMLCLILTCFPAVAAEEPAGNPEFFVLYRGDVEANRELIFYTEPEQADAQYFVRLDEGDWVVLPGDSFTLPSGAPGRHTLWVTAQSQDAASLNTLEIVYTIESEPEITEPVETEPEETEPEETEPEETEPEETEPEETEPEETEPEETIPGPGLFFGQLHGHSSLSDSLQSPQNAFQEASQTMDFFGLTDLSHCFDSADASANSEAWLAGKAAAAEATGNRFLGLFGYEMAWPSRMQLGHIAVFNTSDFHSWEEDAYSVQETGLENFYASLASQPFAIGMFLHPGRQYGTFENFDCCSPGIDRVMCLLDVGSGEDPGLSPYHYYTMALDKGWHVAPAASSGAGRTVVLGESLTEDGILSALRSRKAYATEDSDLEILYTLDGHPMGSILKYRQIGDAADISVLLRDSTDTAIGSVEVIGDGGKTLAVSALSENEGQLSFSLQEQCHYYYLRLTQPDGDTAVTAPVWVEYEEHLSIEALTCETAVPAQGEEVLLQLTFANWETVGFAVDGVSVYADGILLAEDTSLTAVPAGSALSHTLRFACDVIGATEITVEVNGTLEGQPRAYRESIPLIFRRKALVTDILVDGSHGSLGTSQLKLLEKAAAQKGIRPTLLTESPGEEALKTCRFLLVLPPLESFRQDFVEAVKEYIFYGGNLIVCAQAESPGNPELNRLLEAVGASARIGEPLPGINHQLTDFADSLWCSRITEGQTYRMAAGCRVLPNGADWLVRTEAPDPSAVLVMEETEAQGLIFTAGSFFLSDPYLQEPANIWDPPTANRTIAENLLGIGGESLPLSTIRQSRAAEENTTLRIRGYVTAGTSNPYNRFPNTLYVQDETGGIAVTGPLSETIPLSAPVEIIGTAGNVDGNRVLKLTDCTLLDAPSRRVPAGTGNWDSLLDPESHGGELVQVKGRCTAVSKNADGTIHRITLTDSGGNTAIVLIEPFIRSGADGQNTLHKAIVKDCTVRATGLLHVEDGIPVIRVRNCDEVEYEKAEEPKKPVNIIPETGDRAPFWEGAMAVSLLTLVYLAIKRNKKSPQG